MSTNATIQVSTGAAEFLHSIIDTTPAKDRKESNIMAGLFRSMKPVIDEANARRRVLDKKYQEEEEVDSPQGGTSKVLRVPDSKRPAFEEELEQLISKKVDISFDRNEFIYLKGLIDNVFERNPNVKNGLAGALHIRLYDEITAAIDNVEVGGASKKK